MCVRACVVEQGKYLFRETLMLSFPSTAACLAMLFVLLSELTMSSQLTDISGP